MKPTQSIQQKMRQFFVILLPIFVTQITLSAMTFFDTNMSGHSSSIDLAGVAIGSSLWVPIQVGLSGILMGITPIISQLIGSGHKDKVAYNVIQALWLSLLLALGVLALGGALLPSILHAMKLESNVQYIAFHFLTWLSIGIIPLFGYTVLRSLIDALGQTRISMIITLISLPINVGLNYLLIYGNFGFPKLGGIGAGVASGITYWCIFIIALLFVHKRQPFASLGIFRTFHKLSPRTWKEQLKIGIPIGWNQ
ncbi:MATE family efflux transporter [Paenibacillus sp. IHBB 10380]|uniref:MATE family efflux transporter n=1 Tax=Paenibacillus sp. IHBB 10380 TaxID=1566358 RepID=UPI00069834C8|nr:MATE family efflux transporter [Paenibacillus sp. IHBB 10380]